MVPIISVKSTNKFLVLLTVSIATVLLVIANNWQHCSDRLNLGASRSMNKCKGPQLGVTRLTLLLTVCIMISRPVMSQQLQNWVTDLSEQVYGTLYSTQSGINTSDLVKGWYVDPFPQDEAAEAPAVVLIARGMTEALVHERDCCIQTVSADHPACVNSCALQSAKAARCVQEAQMS